MARKSGLLSLSKLVAEVESKDSKLLLDRVTSIKWTLPNASLLTIDITMRARIFCESLAACLDFGQAKADAGYDECLSLSDILNKDSSVFLDRLLHLRIDAESESDWKVYGAAMEATNLARDGSLPGPQLEALIKAIKLRAQMRGMLVVEQESPRALGLPMLRAGKPPEAASNGSGD
jgi:hypothetical protein